MVTDWTNDSSVAECIVRECDLLGIQTKNNQFGNKILGLFDGKWCEFFYQIHDDKIHFNFDI